jgi:hypothetical protein
MHARKNLLLALSLVLAFAVLGHAQTERATLSGRVVDRSNAVIRGATVTVTNIGTSASAKTTTNGEGLYFVPNLPPGQYRLRVEMEGFESLLRPDVTLQVQDQVVLNFTMTVGSRIETMTVTGDVSLINTESPAVSTVVDQNLVENLPLNGRSFQSLLLLAPGVVMVPVHSGNMGQFSVDGQRADSNYVTVDGVSANFGLSTYYLMGESLGGAVPATNALGGYNSLASVDSVQEFRIQTSSYAPEFGRQPGGQVSIVTRSGTNAYHGSAYDYLRNDVFDARDDFNHVCTNAGCTPGKKPPLRQNDFGGVLGGPIIKDKAFFFFSYEGLRLRKPQIGDFAVPTVALRNSAQAAAQPLLNMFPLPTPGGLDYGNGTAEERASWSDPGTMDDYSARVDVNLRHNLTLFGRYNYSPSQISLRGGGSNGLAALSEVDSNLMHIVTTTVGLTWVQSHTRANDLRFNYSRDKGDANGTLTPFGGAIVPSDSYFFPSNSGYSFKTGQFAMCVISGCDYVHHDFFQIGKQNNSLTRAYNLVDTQSIAQGKHNLKIGGDYRRNSMFFFPFSYLSEPYPADFTSLAQGQVFEYQVLTSIASSVHDHNVGVYAQDTWKATPRLVLTYGLRWDLETPMMRGNGLPQVTASGLEQSDPTKVNFSVTHGHPYPTQWKNFAPRVGATYAISNRPGRELVVRGGYGIFYNLIGQSAGMLVYGWTGYPISASKFGFNTTWPFPSDVSKVPTIAFDPTAGSVMYNPTMKTPYIHEFNAAIEQSLGADQVLTVSYVGALGKRLALEADAYNLGPPPSSAYASVYGVNTGWSRYNALQVQFKRRLTHGFDAMASYNWSHSIDNGSMNSLGYGSDNGIYGQGSANINKGPSEFDMRQSFSAAVTYNIPSPKFNRFTSAAFGGWALNNIVMARSSLPSDVCGTIYGFQFGTQSTFCERPDRAPGVPLYLYGSEYPGGKAVNLAAFTLPPAAPGYPEGLYFPSRQGNLERYGLRNFPAVQWDTGVRRTFKFTDRFQMQFRMEAFNILNHPNLGFFGGSNSGTQQVALNYAIVNGVPTITPGYGVSAVGNGIVVSSTLGQALQGAYGGVNPLYAIGGPRSMQASLKFTF